LLKVKAGEGRLLFFKPVPFDEGEPVAIEHKSNIDEE
jgi:hypothetical protein